MTLSRNQDALTGATAQAHVTQMMRYTGATAHAHVTQMMRCTHRRNSPSSCDTDDEIHTGATASSCDTHDEMHTQAYMIVQAMSEDATDSESFRLYPDTRPDTPI